MPVTDPWASDAPPKPSPDPHHAPSGYCLSGNPERLLALIADPGVAIVRARSMGAVIATGDIARD
jgi:hypothetical protein